MNGHIFFVVGDGKRLQFNVLGVAAVYLGRDDAARGLLGLHRNDAGLGSGPKVLDGGDWNSVPTAAERFASKIVSVHSRPERLTSSSPRSNCTQRSRCWPA